MVDVEIKQIDPAALSTLLHGIVLCDFSRVHEAAEWLAGHPVFTHQFLDKPLRARIDAEILRQFPDMETSKPRDWAARRDKVRARYGNPVEVKRGDSGRPPDLLDGLPSDTPVVLVAI